jgi:mono/diheme cytochrome c family protein
MLYCALNFSREQKRMTFSRLAFIVIGLAILVAGCSKSNQTTVTPQATPSSAKASPTLDEFATVRVIFTKDCVSCHGDTGQGGPVKVEGKTLKVPPLSSGHALQHSDKDFLEQISKGGEGMPAFEKKMTPAEIAEMIRFIRKELQHK